MNEEEIGREIVDAAILIHRQTGPGLLEYVYEAIMEIELQERGFAVQKQLLVPVSWKGKTLDQGFRADLIIEQKVIIELKSVESVNNAHKKQLLTYFKLTDMKLGYLLNFGESFMKNGIHRTVNHL